jgi:hypothetical protein
MVGFGVVLFGPATLDVALPNNLAALFLDGWSNTLTLNFSLTVGSTGGSFVFTDSSTISIAAGMSLALQDLGTHAPAQNLWTGGTITGGDGSALAVTGCELDIQGAPRGLGTNLYIYKSAVTGNAGVVVLSSFTDPAAGATNNLKLTGASNFIDVNPESYLRLYQHIATAGMQNREGGIELGAAHTASSLAVQLEAKNLQTDQFGGTLYRSDAAAAGIPDQVSIGGYVYNLGGTAEVFSALLNITGTTGNISYWQKQSTDAALKIDSGANINATGTYQIDAGLVQFKGGGDQLDGAGLNFGNVMATTLAIVDIELTQVTVTVQGPVTLAANTTTKLNYMGARNTSDVLDVKNGPLTLAGTLYLASLDGRKPTQPLFFLDDSGNGATINGDFASIGGSLTGTYKGAKKPINATLIYYQVTIT